jgi:uncharacterized protein (DUF2062 family)
MYLAVRGRQYMTTYHASINYVLARDNVIQEWISITMGNPLTTSVLWLLAYEYLWWLCDIHISAT